MAYSDFVRALKNLDPANLDVDRLSADAEREHQADLAEQVGIRDAAIAERDQNLDAKTAEIQKLKADNYDLLMRTKADMSDNPAAKGPDGPEAGDVSETPTLASLMTRE